MMNLFSQLSYVKLPMELSHLCRLNMSGNAYKDSLERLVIKNPSLMFLIQNAFKNLDDGRGVEKIISGLGWNGLRDRLSSIYAGKVFFGHYPKTIQLDLIDDVKEFENSFQIYGVAGYSRVFLLGLYIKFLNLNRLSLENSDEIQFEVNLDVHTILKFSKIKVEKIDYLILFLHQLLQFVELEEAIELIKSKLNFIQIYESLKREERKMIHDNFLAYSSSIFEPDFFLYEKV